MMYKNNSNNSTENQNALKSLEGYFFNIEKTKYIYILCTTSLS